MIRSHAIFLVLCLGLGSAQAAPDEAPAASDVEESAGFSGWKAGRWTCLLLGAAAIGVGGSAYYLGAAEDDVVASATRENDVVQNVSQTEAKRRQDAGDNRRQFGVASIGIGAALLAVGITLWALEPAPVAKAKIEVEPEPDVRPFGYRIGPRVDPSSGGLGGEVALMWSF